MQKANDDQERYTVAINEVINAYDEKLASKDAGSKLNYYNSKSMPKMQR